MRLYKTTFGFYINLDNVICIIQREENKTHTRFVCVDDFSYWTEKHINEVIKEIEAISNAEQFPTIGGEV